MSSSSAVLIAAKQTHEYEPGSLRICTLQVRGADLVGHARAYKVRLGHNVHNATQSFVRTQQVEHLGSRTISHSQWYPRAHEVRTCLYMSEIACSTPAYGLTCASYVRKS